MGFAGAIGAGKTTGAEYLAEAYRFRYVRYSQVLAKWAAEDEDARGPLQARGWEIMSMGLQTELNQRVLADIGSDGNYAIDGLRHDIDVSSLREAFAESFFLLYVEAPERTRWERTFGSGRFTSRKAFREADHHPVERPLRALRSRAFAVVQNSGSLGTYQQALDSAIRRIGKASIGELP